MAAAWESAPLLDSKPKANAWESAPLLESPAPMEPPKQQYQGRNIDDMSGVSKFLIGAGNSAMDLGRGALQVAGIDKKDGFGSQQDIVESRQLSKALNKTVPGAIGSFVGSTVPTVLTGGASLPAAVASGAVYGGLQPTLDNESRQVNMLTGVGGSLVGAGLTAGLGRMVKGFTPSKDAAELMKRGIQPTVGQGIEQGTIGRGIRKAEEATQSLPFLGAITKNARDRSLKEFTQAAIKEAELPKLGVSANGAVGHEAISNLKKGFNQAYEKTLGNHAIPIKPELTQKIGANIADDSLLLNMAERKQLTDYLQGQFGKMSVLPNGRYLAKDLHAIESNIGEKIRALPPGDERRLLLQNVKETLVNYRDTNLPAEVGKKIKEINGAYANFTRLREASKGVGAEHGEFSPAQLYNKAVMMDKSGQASSGNALMQRLAGQGKSVLSDKLGDSGTAPRMLTNQLLAGGGIEGAAAYFALPKMLALGGIMGAGSTKAAQKALLGGYAGQKTLSKNINRLLPLAEITGAATASRQTRE